MKGAYLLIFEHPTTLTLRVGKKRVITFKRGTYGYIGSALKGLEQRIARHLRSQKKLHWHIDYLLSHTTITHVFIKEGMKREECDLAYHFEQAFETIPGFGCSDCACESHLFYGSADAIRKRATDLQMKPYPLDANS